MNIAFEMLFLIVSNIKVNFNNRKLWWGLYTIVKTLLITKQVELVGKKKFVVVVLDLENEIFVVHIVFLAISNLNKLYSSYWTQIALLKVIKLSPLFSWNIPTFSLPN